MTTTPIQLVDGIAALDRDKQVLDQTTIDEINKQRDLYKTALDTFVEGLKQLQAKKASLQERLVVRSDAPSQLKENADILPSKASTAAAPTSTTDPMTETLSAIDNQDHEIQELTQKTIDKCTRQRDLYRDALYRLNTQVEKTEKEIRELEAQLAQQALLASTPKAVQELPISSPHADLAKDVSRVTVSRITAKDSELVLINLTLMLYLEKTKAFQLDASLSEKDPVLLQAAKDAFNLIEQEIPENRRSGSYAHEGIVRTLLLSNARNVNHKAQIQSGGEKKNFDTIIQKTTAEIGKIKGIFGHFYSKWERQSKVRKSQKEGEAQYADFPFNSVAFLAGQLCLVQKILKGCLVDCKEKLGLAHPKTQEVEKELKDIQIVQASFFELLKKCRLPKPKY